MSDLISRQDAIRIASGYCHPANIVEELRKLPSAQKNGEWIECDHEKWIIGVHGLRCSQCGGGYHLNNEMTIYYWNYCPKCGADMRGEEDEL